MLGPSVLWQSLNPNLVVEVEQLFVAQSFLSVKATKLVQEFDSDLPFNLPSEARTLNVSGPFQACRGVLIVHETALSEVVFNESWAFTS